MGVMNIWETEQKRVDHKRKCSNSRYGPQCFVVARINPDTRGVSRGFVHDGDSNTPTVNTNNGPNSETVWMGGFLFDEEKD